MTMKFTAGYWMFRPGVTPMFPAQVHDVQADADGLTLYAHQTDRKPRRHVEPAAAHDPADVAVAQCDRVQMVHHKGRRLRDPPI
ncbi:MAG: hypothetical protein R2856_34020 [Caldilineaceae bacterium]